MNSWAGDWGKQGYAWLPSEMLLFTEFGFSTKAQHDVTNIIDSNDIFVYDLNFSIKKYRKNPEN